MKRYFTKAQLADIRAKFLAVEGKADRLVLRYVGHRFKNTQAGEFAHHGFGRRVGTMRRCMENVWKTVPPTTVKVPPKSKLYDVQINIQSFVTNLYGCVDNLAWVWVHERGLAGSIPRSNVGLRKRHAALRASLSDEFRAHLGTLDAWFEYVVEYRDALAHRIPLYVPPGGVRPKDVDAYNSISAAMTDALNRLDPDGYFRLQVHQDELLVFQPLITHSVSETTAHFAFHAQMIADFLTIEELGEKMLAELKKP
jgi:hypothetical protein